MELRALTIRHPYAQAIACGLKKIETRGQRTHYRGRLAVHAAVGYALPLALADLDCVLAECRSSGVETQPIRTSLEMPEYWRFGKIIALAELCHCVPVEEPQVRSSAPSATTRRGGSAGGWPVWCGCLSLFRREACRDYGG